MGEISYVVTLFYMEGEDVLGNERESGPAGLTGDEIWPWMIHWGKILTPRAAWRRGSQEQVRLVSFFPPLISLRKTLKKSDKQSIKK